VILGRIRDRGYRDDTASETHDHDVFAHPYCDATGYSIANAAKRVCSRVH
jgi:hypothetical protein